MKLDQFMKESMQAVLEDLREQQSEIIQKMLGEGIKKGCITVRQSDPVLVLEKNPHSGEEKIRLLNSCVIDYLGQERIEELEKALAYMTKVNGDLHQSLQEFYERTKQNTWLKNQN